MKILSGIVVSLLAHNGVHAASDKDQHHLRGFEVPPGPRMWVFGDTGLRVYSPDGKEVLKSLTANEVCHPVTGHRSDNDRLEEGNSLRCTFWAAVPDGKKYVWAAVARGVPKIDVFSLDTGDLVGSFETCNNVQRMEYHPLRDEIWVRCGAVSQSTESYMDVFSASSPSATIDTRVLVKENTTHSGWGHFAIDPSLGDVGYTTTWGEPYIYKVDLSAKNILSKIDAPAVWGVYDLAYSRVNQHMYLRTLVCCTCGFEGADKADCGRYGASKVDIISGPQAGQKQVDGQCGRCDGTKADTIGIYEFDTNSETVISRIFGSDGSTGVPAVSPDGKYIVIFERTGGSSIRILRAGEPGVPAQIAFDIKLDFLTAGFEDVIVFNDFAFIQDKDRNIFVLSSYAENKVALIDLSLSSPTASYITFKTGNSTATASRQVEWARGTDYVWISGAAENELYVLDIAKKQLVTTVKDVHTTYLLSVTNFERLGLWNMINSGSSGGRGDSTTPEELQRLAGVGGANNKDDGPDAVAIAAIVLAAVAILVGVANLVQTRSNSSSSNNRTNNNNNNNSAPHPPTHRVTTIAKGSAQDEVSLGSKDVN